MGDITGRYEESVERLIALVESYQDIVRGAGIFAIATACLGASIAWGVAGGSLAVEALLLVAYWVIAAMAWRVATKFRRVPIPMERLKRWEAWAVITAAIGTLVIAPAISITQMILAS